MTDYSSKHFQQFADNYLTHSELYTSLLYHSIHEGKDQGFLLV